MPPPTLSQASIALPFTNGFVGEFLILLGTFRWSPRFAAFAATGVFLSAVYMLWMFQRVNYGPLTNEENRALPDLSPREWSLVVPIVAMAIFKGVAPGIFLRPMEASVNRVIDRVTRGAPVQAGRNGRPSVPASAGTPGLTPESLQLPPNVLTAFT